MRSKIGYLDRRLVLGSLASLLALPVAVHAEDVLPAVTPDVAAIKAEVEAIVARFMTRAGAALAAFKAPAVVIEFTPELSWISEDGNTIHSVAWSQCPPDFQGLITAWVGDNSPMPAGHFFGEVFNAFLVPHELGHFADVKRGYRGDRAKFFEGEVYANRVAVAFWLGEPGGRERMEKLMQAVAIVESHLANPVPAGQDKIAYFNANYEALGSNPPAYGWYQFRMFLDAWELRDEKDFKALIERVV